MVLMMLIIFCIFILYLVFEINTPTFEDYIDMGKYVDHNADRIFEKTMIKPNNNMLEIYNLLFNEPYCIAKIPIDKVTNIFISDNRGEYYTMMVKSRFLFSFSPLQPKTVPRIDRFSVAIVWQNDDSEEVTVFAFCMPDAIAEKRATHAANELIKICGLPQVTKI